MNVEEFWQQSTQILASGEPAVLAQLIQVQHSHASSVSDWVLPTAHVVRGMSLLPHRSMNNP
jgi:hypothetical protein